MTPSPFTLDVDSNGVARLVFDLPNEKVNKFSRDTLAALDTVLETLENNEQIRILVISSAKENIFVAGADLREFERAFRSPEISKTMINEGHRLFRRLEKLPYPTIAVIHGACLGGGLEFALACRYRIVSDHPKTVLGLPEVTLGIIPGWGGTQRLPRLVGLENSLSMILTGKPVPAIKAWKMGLADAIVPWEFLDHKVEEFISNCLKGKIEKRHPGGLRVTLLEKNWIGQKLLFRKAKSDVLQKTKGHYPAPLVALQLIEETHGLPLDEGLAKEAQTFIENITTTFSASKHLIHLFFTQEALKKEPGIKLSAAPRKVKATGVIGAGTMGAGIAWLLSNHGRPVRLKDISWEAIGKGYGAAHELYEQMVARKKLKPTQASFKFHHISGTTDYIGFHPLDLVIEAAVEDLPLKLKILNELEANLSEEAIIATNTSSLSVNRLSEALKHPERFVGLHFFNPVNRMPLVEVAYGEKTSAETIASAVELCRKLRKTPIVVKDCPGFLVNRIFAAGQNAAMHLLEEGVPMEQLEKAMVAFGMPMGPFTLADTVGNDIGYKVAKHFEEAYGARMQPPMIIEALYEHAFYGKKNGKGFYTYSGKRKKPNPDLKAFLPKTQVHLSDKAIVEKVIKSMAKEATRCLDEGIVTDADTLDMALVLGIGFPPFRGGLLRYARENSLV